MGATTRYRIRGQPHAALRRQAAPLMAHSLIIGGPPQELIAQALTAIHNGSGVLYLDASGHDTAIILDRIPKRRQRDVILFDLEDTDFPIAFNPLNTDEPVANIISVLENAIKDSALLPNASTSVMSMFIASALSVIIEHDEPFLGFPYLFLKQDYRTTLTSSLTDPYPQLFWKSFDEQAIKDKRREFSSTFNKAYMMFFDRRIRNVIGQKRTALHVKDIHDGAIILARLPITVLGRERTSLIGLLLLAAAHLTQQASPAQIFIQNVHLFRGQLLSDMLDSTIPLTISHSSLAQLDKFKAVVLANTEHKYVFRVSKPDAKELNQAQGEDAGRVELYKLGRGLARYFYGSKIEEREVTDLPDPTSALRPAYIRARSRRLARPRAVVEKELDRFLRGF